MERVAAEASPDGFALHTIKASDGAWAALAALLATDGCSSTLGEITESRGSINASSSPGPGVSRTPHSGALTARPRVRLRPRWAERGLRRSPFAALGAAVPGAKELRADLNEVYLLHGTTPDIVLSILAGGLNERYSSVAAFGDGEAVVPTHCKN